MSDKFIDSYKKMIKKKLKDIKKKKEKLKIFKI